MGVPMKLFAKVMIAVLFIAMLLPFTILRGPDGNTLMSFSDFELPDFSLPDMPKIPSGESISSQLDSGKDIFYQWHDAEGNVQFTTEPPPEGIEYTVKGYDPDTNVIQAIELPSEEAQVEEGPADEEKKTDPTGNPYSPERIEKLFDDAKNVEKLLNQRLKDQEAAINQ